MSYEQSGGIRRKGKGRAGIPGGRIRGKKSNLRDFFAIVCMMKSRWSGCRRD